MTTLARRRIAALTSQTLVATVALCVAAGLALAATAARNTVTSASIKDNQVASADIRNGAVATVDLKARSVTSAKLASGAVRSANLADGTILAADLAAGSVGATQLGAGAVGATQLAIGAVTSAQLADGSVTSAKLADGSVITAKIAAGAVTGGKLADGSVGLGKLDVSGGTDGQFLRRGTGGVAEWHSLPQYEPASNRTVHVNALSDVVAAGTNLRTLLSTLPAATSDQPWLVVLEPGTYDLGATPLALPTNVTVQGESLHSADTNLTSSAVPAFTVAVGAAPVLARLAVTHVSSTSGAVFDVDGSLSARSVSVNAVGNAPERDIFAVTNSSVTLIDSYVTSTVSSVGAHTDAFESSNGSVGMMRSAAFVNGTGGGAGRVFHGDGGFSASDVDESGSGLSGTNGAIVATGNLFVALRRTAVTGDITMDATGSLRAEYSLLISTPTSTGATLLCVSSNDYITGAALTPATCA